MRAIPPRSSPRPTRPCTGSKTRQNSGVAAREWPARIPRGRSMKRSFAALAFALAACALPALAQQDYPNHTITMVVPFPPGGVADITARPLAEALTRILKQTVIVENKPGAGGGLGMQYVARARPDGYTVLLA